MSVVEHASSLSGSDASLALALLLALLVGIRHAADPDHLVAVSALVAGEPDAPTRRALTLGLAWGCGHATTVVALGLPVVLLHRHVPARVHAAAEVAVGLLIVALALRLLARWRAGHFHVHEHEHDGRVHRHLHVHEREPAHPREHAHEHAAPRSPLQGLGLGLVHGVGGSAAVGVLLFASLEGAAAAAALAVFAAGAALSMAALTAGAGYLLGRHPVRRRLNAIIPALGGLTVVFGAWYAAAAVVS